MFPVHEERQIRIVGIALEGRHGDPVVVFRDSVGEGFLSLGVDPFEADGLIRELSPLEDDTAVSWLAEGLGRSMPKSAFLIKSTDERWRVRFIGGKSASGRSLPLAQGVALCRQADIPLFGEQHLFDSSRDELTWLSSSGKFLGDFLYLSPLQYAPGTAVD